MSCPCGRSATGSNSTPAPAALVPAAPVPADSDDALRSQPAVQSAVNEESIQVSKTSFSPSNSVPPQFTQAVFGLVSKGSTGNSSPSSSAATFTAPQFLQYQTGIGTLKIRCREMHQSHSIVSTQFSSRTRKCSGCHLISCAAFFTASFCTRTNHCRVEIISIGVLHRQQTPTLCRSLSRLLSSPAASKSATTFRLHSVTLSPS